MFWCLILSCLIWILLAFITCSSWEFTAISGSPCSKCRCNCTGLSVTDSELWFHFCSCKSGRCICLTNCGCRLSWIDYGVFLSNHTSVVMKLCFTIFVEVTHSAELFTGIRNCLFWEKRSWAADSGEDSAVFLQVQNNCEGSQLGLQSITTVLNLQHPGNPTISSLFLCTVLAWHLSLFQKLSGSG